MLLACKHKTDNDVITIASVTSIEQEEVLISIKESEETGIFFKNTIKENRNLNGILYEYLYNGGGVAMADFNQDNLLDIYFVSNLEANGLYLNQGKLKFKDISKVSGTCTEGGFSTGVTIVDINADGKQDIYVCKSGKYGNPNDRRNELYVNQGNNAEGIPTFIESAKKYGLDLPHFSTQAAFFDYDRDGDLDMFLINHGTKPYEDEQMTFLQNKEAPLQSSRLFKNDNGFYKDVSDSSGIINSAISFGLGLAISDLNNDTWPDIIVGHDFSEKDHIYINQKNGTFKEVVAQATNHISYFSMGNDAADINNDGLVDFISLDMMSENNYDAKTSMSGMNPERFYELKKQGLHNQYMFNALQINRGIPKPENNIPFFSDVAQHAGVSGTDWSWGPLFLDLDNDGYKDLFVSNGIKRDFRNNDFLKYKKEKFDVFFSKYGAKTKVNQERAKDLIIQLVNEMPIRKKENYFFHNLNGKGFSKQKILNTNLPTNSNGTAYGDLDNDGDLDMVVNNMDDFAFIYENKTSELKGSNYLKIKLQGDSKNVNAIGAKVSILYNGKEQHQECFVTRGFQSASSSILHFGLGTLKNVDQVNIRWPNGKYSSVKNVAVNQLSTISYAELDKVHPKEALKRHIFKDETNTSKLNFIHQENEFNDFEREGLLPHRMSRMGPSLAVADVNSDGLDDVFVGGALGQSAALYYQKSNGEFIKSSSTSFNKNLESEDTAALFFDADGDGDKDLYVVSGGNEYAHGTPNLYDHFYENSNGEFMERNSIPKIGISGSCVKSADYDLDGDLDLFIGGRQLPANYPEPVSSIILRNDSKDGNIKFTNVTNQIAEKLTDIGMVTDAIWFDYNNDKWLDLMLVGEWMSPRVFQNNQGTFKDVTEKTGLQEEKGWWFSIASADFDGDGDQDIIAGNLGLNYKYKANKEEPFKIYQRDFDGNGTKDIVLGYYDLGNLYPLRGRECSSNQIPNIKEKFKTYHAFAQATLTDVYGEDDLINAIQYKANNFASCYFKNNGDGTFSTIKLGFGAQLSSVNDIAIDDFDGDGFLDALISGNWYVSEVETPRNDASVGLFLKGNGKGMFKEIPADQSGLYIKGDVRKSALINTTGGKALVVAKNNEAVQLISILPKQ